MNGRKIAQNAIWIILCRIVQSIISLVIGMMSARYLGPSNYGVINYAASIVAFAVPIMYLGINNILVQEIINNPDDEGKIIGTSVTLSFFSAIACIAGVFAFTSIVNAGETETIVVCLLYSLLMLFQSVDLIQYWFQAKLISKYASVASLIAYICVAVYRLYLLFSRKSVYMFALSQMIDFLVIAAILYIVYSKLNGPKFEFSLGTAKRIFSKSRYYIVSSLMVTIFAQTDKIMLKLMLSEEAVGYYSAAVTCAGITAFVFAAIIDSFRPAIFETKKQDKEIYETNISRLYSIILYLSLFQSLFMAIFSNEIIYILYGSQYAPASSALQIIVWYTTFAYLGSVRNIWILAESKHKYLWIINLAGALANILLNYICRPCWGINGAAFASLITQIFTNVIIGYIIRPISYNNKLMLKGLHLKYLYSFLKYLKK